MLKNDEILLKTDKFLHVKTVPRARGHRKSVAFLRSVLYTNEASSNRNADSSNGKWRFVLLKKRRVFFLCECSEWIPGLVFKKHDDRWRPGLGDFTRNPELSMPETTGIWPLILSIFHWKFRWMWLKLVVIARGSGQCYGSGAAELWETLMNFVLTSTRNCVSKARSCVSKTRNLVFKWWIRFCRRAGAAASQLHGRLDATGNFIETCFHEDSSIGLFLHESSWNMFLWRFFNRYPTFQGHCYVIFYNNDY